MNLKSKRRMIARLFGVGVARVRFNPERQEEVKEAITRGDLRGLLGQRVVSLDQKQGVSRARVRKRNIQKRKGLRQGQGKRKGRHTARLPQKKAWMLKVRAQRIFLKDLKEKGLISTTHFRQVYQRSKGGFFRSRRHVKLYLEENGLFIKKNNALPKKN